MSSLPSSYASLPFQHIRVSHVPSSSPTPTPVIIVTLYRPGKHNAFTDTMTLDLENAFSLLSLDPRIKAIVVTGHEKMFCAGADLTTGLSYQEDTARTHRDGGGRVALAIHRCTKPVIAAINGSAVGVGITMTLPMNIRIVSEKAKIGFVFARRGIVMEAASSFFLPRLVGMSKAMHLVTTGSVYPSTDPLFRELFTEILPPEKVLPRALELAQDIAKNTSAVSTHLMKDMMWRNPGTAEATHLLDSKILLQLFDGKDKKEGVDSFLEKREPEFKGDMVDDAPTAWPWWEPIDTKAPETVDSLKSKL
ncbi:AF-toxin biosynthesis 3-1 [Hyphodiscus hymeniophilus]|uniref:AF-toxin biosynthesis 3-1 n=1 Tax=Hyphodiscus hymeniophilus TaxID=353542 RepID=A0A9P6VN84_9HELO|nr:AF-toxin biosynthesis 3-1 [Hyphodiscus hymeniophilus]